VLERAVELSRAIGDQSLIEVSVAFLCGHNMQRGRHVLTRELGEELVRLSNDNPGLGNAIAGRFMLSLGLLLTGSFEECVSRADEAIAIHDPDDMRPIAPGSTDMGVACHSIKAFALWALGHPDLAVDEAATGVQLARRRKPSPHYHTLCWTLTFAAQLHLHRREPTQLRTYAEELVELASQHGYNRLLAWGNSLLACARIVEGEYEHGVTTLEESLVSDDYEEAGFWRSHCQGLLAVAYGGLGRYGPAFGLLQRAKARMASRGERFYEGDLHRVEGDLLLQQDRNAFEPAERCYQNALDLARKINGRSWELRALVSLTRMRIAQGRGDEACAELRRLLESFEEGVRTPDIVDARALLEGRA
jgi:adenylate cyclase